MADNLTLLFLPLFSHLLPTICVPSSSPLKQSTERTQQVNRQLNQRQPSSVQQDEEEEDITLEAEETEVDYTGNPVFRSQVTDLGSATRNEDEESLVDEDILDSEINYIDEEEEEEESFEEDEGDISLEQAEYIRFHQEFFEKNGYPHPDMALDGDDVVPINGGGDEHPHPHQQQQQQQHVQQQQQPGIVASQLAPGQQGDIVSLTASDGQVLTFSPGHQHYDQALQLHHNTQAAIQQQQQLQQQQAEPPISVEDGESIT